MPRFVLASLLGLSLGACSAPEPADVSVSLVSEHGLLDADVRIASPVVRGENEVFVELRPHDAAGEARLLSVDATMAAHGHAAHAEQIEHTAAGYRAGPLSLFMTGRWLVELQLSLDDEADSVSLPVDVP